MKMKETRLGTDLEAKFDKVLGSFENDSLINVTLDKKEI